MLGKRAIASGGRYFFSLVNRVRGWLVPVVLLAGLYGFGRTLQPDFPIQEWFFWRYLLYWVVALIWLASCFCCGHAILRQALRSPLPVLEHVTMALAVGLLVFFLLMFVGGLARLYGPAFFVGLPLVMLGSGARSSFVYCKRLLRGLSAARARHSPQFSAAKIALWGVGLIALFLFYLPGLVPAHISYDASWYHVPIGEHYARLGRIERFGEGWYSGAIPHLSSVVYAYAFQLPHGTIFDFVELSAHLEFASALMMLPGIPALVRRLAPGARAHVSWIAFFAFPSLAWYDLLIGGDQFSAVWSVPICLMLLRVLPNLYWRHGLLLACAIAGETLTKYSASGILVGPAVAVAIRMLWLAGSALWRERSAAAAVKAPLRGVAIGAAVLLLTTPLWAKNWLWYGDPFYPLLNKYFHSRPWSEDATVYFVDYTKEMKNWQPPPGWPGLKEAFWATLNHAFKPADFSPGPYRGALFTLMCACIPFVRASWRLWVCGAVLHVAVLFWFIQMHQDRYLIAFMPAMSAVLVAAAILAWRTSLVARVSVLALFTFHSVWGLRVLALSAPTEYYRSVLDFAAAAARGDKDAGLGDLARWDKIGKTMPANAKVLIHAMHAHVGIGHPSVSDWTRIEGGISYGRLDSPAAVYQTLHDLGITHLVWATNWGDDSFSGDLRFLEFATKYTNPKQIDGLWVGTMPSAPPAPREPGLIAFLSCGDRYEGGLYPFSALTVPNPRNEAQPPYPNALEPMTALNEASIVARARYVVFNATCGFREEATIKREFVFLGIRGENWYTLYARKDPR